MENIIITKNLYKIYGEGDSKFEALTDININIKEGKFLGIMGASGSGKTTLVNILSTLDQHTKGKAFIGKEDIENERDFRKIHNGELSDFRKKNIGFVFQNYDLLDIYKNRENILIPLMIVDIDDKEGTKRINEIAEILEIGKLLDKYPYECSGGEKQRIAIARALINNPKIIFADEPTDSLDVKNGIQVLNLLRRLNDRFKITIILVTHDPIMASFCERIFLVNEGRIQGELKNKSKKQIEFYNEIMENTTEEVKKLLDRNIKKM